MSEQTYTLNAARHELAKRDCAMNGHNWTVLEGVGMGPTAILCDHCGRSHRVGQVEVEYDPNFRASDAPRQ